MLLRFFFTSDPDELFFVCVWYNNAVFGSLATLFLSSLSNVQKSVVAVSMTPYVGLLKQVVKVVGPLFFAAEASGSATAPIELLNRVFDEAAHWPPLIPGTSVYLPLMSDLLQWQVPWTGLHNYRPSFIAPLQPPGLASHLLKESSSALSIASAAGHSASCSTLSSVDEPLGSPPATSTSIVDESLASAAITAQLNRVNLGPAVTPVVSSEHGDGLREPYLSKARVPQNALYASSVVSGISQKERRPGDQLSLSDVFAASSLELAGLFQEVGLFSVFRSLSPCLWHLWELVITGQPVLVMGSSPERCGDAVLALVSLISPLEFCADYRPYFTLFDPDFQEVRNCPRA